MDTGNNVPAGSGAGEILDRMVRIGERLTRAGAEQRCDAIARAVAELTRARLAAVVVPGPGGPALAAVHPP